MRTVSYRHPFYCILAASVFQVFFRPGTFWWFNWMGRAESVKKEKGDKVTQVCLALPVRKLVFRTVRSTNLKLS